MSKYSEHELAEAEIWFEKFGRLLQGMGFDLDNPYAMGLIKIQGIKLPPKEVIPPAPKAVFRDAGTFPEDEPHTYTILGRFQPKEDVNEEEVATELRRLGNTKTYAFMKRNEDGSYLKPKEPGQNSIEWLGQNLLSFRQATPELKAYLHEMSKAGRLSVSELTFELEDRAKSHFVFENTDGELRLTRDLAPKADTLDSFSVMVRDQENRLAIMEQDLKRLDEKLQKAQNGRCFVMEELTEEQAKAETARINEDPVYCSIKEERAALSTIDLEETADLFERVDKLRELTKASRPYDIQLRNLIQRKLEKETDLAPEQKQAVIDDLTAQRMKLEEEIAAEKANNLLEQAKIPPDTFRKLASVLEFRTELNAICSNLNYNFTTITRNKNIRMPKDLAPDERQRRQENILKQGKHFWRKSEKNEAEYRFCVMGTYHPEWVAEKGLGFFANELKDCGIPKLVLSDQELSDTPPLATSDFGSIMKSIQKRAGANSLESAMKSGRVCRENGEPFPAASTFDFVNAVTREIINGSPIQITDKNGRTRMYSNNADFGLTTVVNQASHKKLMNELYKDLCKTDSMFSNDSDEYKSVKKQLGEELKKLETNECRYDFITVSGALIEACRSYQQTHTGKALSPRQQERLNVMNRILQADSFINKENRLDAYSVDGLRMQIAEKLVGIISSGLQKGQSALAGQVMQTDAQQHETAFRDMLNSALFKNMVDGLDSTGLETMLHQSGKQLIDRMMTTKRALQHPHQPAQPAREPNVQKDAPHRSLNAK